MTDFRQVVPSANNEAYQYFLVWLSVDGGVRSWLFSHTGGVESEKYNSFSIESLDNIRSVPMMERKEVSAITGSLDGEQFDYVKSIMASNRVYQVTKAGEKIPVALKVGAVVRPNQNKEYKIKIKFIFQEANILNV